MRRFERHQDIEAFLAEVARSMTTPGRPGFVTTRERLFGDARARRSLEDHWAAHLERLGAAFLHVRTVRTATAARDVDIRCVRVGRLDAVYGKARVEIEVDPPLPDANVEAVREHLGDRAREGTGPLRDALLEGMAARSDILLPARRTIRARCTCAETAAVCKHALAMLYAFGTRLHDEPELLVRLRGLELLDLSPGPLAAEKQAFTGDLVAVFGVDMVDIEVASIESAGIEDEAAANGLAEAKPATVPPSERTEVGREYLRVLGLSCRTIDAWLREGVLGRTDRPEVYQRTPEANRRIARRLAH